VAVLFSAGVLFSALPSLAGAEPQQAAAAVDASKLPKEKQTKLGLYVTALQAYEMWKAAPDKVKVIDVRTPEEFAFVGHPEMAWNIPLAFVTYESKGGKFVYGHRPNTAFVEQVRALAKADDVLLLTCRSGGRGAMAVNALAAAGFTKAYNIVDGIEGDTIQDPESVYNGKRMKNGWKNSAPWGYTIDPERIILQEGAAGQKK
jgi:rhodanese-related sulfurtransferase